MTLKTRSTGLTSVVHPDGTNLGPAMAALADALANPTTSNLGALLQAFNGTTWDRLRAGATNSDAETAATLGALLIKARGYVLNDGTGNWERQRGAPGGDAKPIGGQAAAALVGFNGTTWDRLRSSADKTLHVAARMNGASEVKQIRALSLASGAEVTILTPSSGKRVRVISFSTIYTAALENYTDFYFGESPAASDLIWTAHTEETFRESSMVWPDGGGPLGAVDETVRVNPSTAIAAGAATFHVVYREE